MAAGESGGSWWGSWIQEGFQSMKEKSTEALEFMKRDLAEFSHVVQHDTACTIAATANAVKDKLSAETSTGAGQQVKKGLSNILGVLSDTFAPPPDKTIDCDVITLVATPSGTTELYDSTKARLYSLQADPATYCNEPDGPLELYEEWVAAFNLEDQKGEISGLLVNSPSVRALYTKMVPAAVSHSEFWHRYFYKLYQLEQEENRRIALKQRAEQTTHSEELQWEEEEDEFVGASPVNPDFCHLSQSPSLPVQSPVACSRLEHSIELQNQNIDDITHMPVECQSINTVSTPTELQLRNQISTSSETSRSEETVKEIAGNIVETNLELVVEQELKPKSKDRLSTPDKEANGSPKDQKTKELTAVPTGVMIEAKNTGKLETAKDDGPVDLRVYELNSDSGKSTPSNNGKKGSSTDISEDWEKDFDLDMTEEEVQLALSRVDISEQGFQSPPLKDFFLEFTPNVALTRMTSQILPSKIHFPWISEHIQAPFQISGHIRQNTADLKGHLYSNSPQHGLTDLWLQPWIFKAPLVLEVCSLKLFFLIWNLCLCSFLLTKRKLFLFPIFILCSLFLTWEFPLGISPCLPPCPALWDSHCTMVFPFRLPYLPAFSHYFFFLSCRASPRPAEH